MIVVDTNIVAYLYIPGEFTPLAERLVAKDANWSAPVLWRSEMRNVLALYLRKKLMSFEEVYAIQQKAEWLLRGNEYRIESLQVLRLANSSGLSGYDCEYVALAQQLNLPLITTDKKLLKAFPSVAVSLATAAS